MSNSNGVAIAQLHDWQISGFDLNNGDVRFLIRADDLRRKIAAVFQFHGNFVGALDHVKIGKDVSIGPDNESGAFTLNRLKISLVPARIIFVGRALKEKVLERRGFAIVLF